MRKVYSSQFTVNSRRRKTWNVREKVEWDFNPEYPEGTESTETDREESVRDGARAEGRFIEAVG
jgi:hypothetical protein